LRTATQEYMQIDAPSRTESVKSTSDGSKNISIQAIKYIVSEVKKNYEKNLKYQ
jgi:hypothetical protein